MISIIVPVYNVEKYLERCVQSLLRQKCSQETEIILVDDGSTDGSGVLCDTLAEAYSSKVISLHKPNGGLSSARNFGILHARGEWLTFVDSDDYVSEVYVEDLWELLQKFDADMAVTKVKLRYENNADAILPKDFEDFAATGEQAFYAMYVLQKVNWSGCGKLVKKETMLQYPFPDGYYEDFASAYRYMGACNTIAFGDYGNNYYYVERKGSITRQPIQEKHYRIFAVSDEITQYVKKNYPNMEYACTLIYLNAVLQLLNRVTTTKEQYKAIFKKYQPMFRKNWKMIMRRKDVRKASKYYITLLCTTPGLLHTSTKLLGLLRGEGL